MIMEHGQRRLKNPWKTTHLIDVFCLEKTNNCFIFYNVLANTLILTSKIRLLKNSAEQPHSLELNG